ncbi:MAG: chorismate-binding protein [Candidatus Margulisiibacteriota bacterium]
MEEASRAGYYLAGFLSYEAGYAFEPVLREKDVFDFPLLSFGVYKCSHCRVVPLPLGPCLPAGREGYRVRALDGNFNLSRSDYYKDIERIRDHIAAGDVYQITYCVKHKFDYAGSPYQLYSNLFSFQPVPYPAYVECGDLRILSLSPEMFLQKSKDKIVVKPMKGTWFRDASWLNNLLGGWQLHHDAKNRAENIMIVDLLRNDLGRICYPGTVKTTGLFEVARYRTVYQMTSTVEGKIRGQEPLFYDVFRALFPSGSVTGAPKIRAMQIIRELEKEERRIYTGTIGYITPSRDMFFNVPIRTLLLGKGIGIGAGVGGGEMGVGGGITYYSTAEGEYEECLVKARFLQYNN